MTILKIKLEDRMGWDWCDKVCGSVCVNGSTLIQVNSNYVQLAFPEKGFPRKDLTSQEIATFIRNFLDEGFEAEIQIK